MCQYACDILVALSKTESLTLIIKNIVNSNPLAYTSKHDHLQQANTGIIVIKHKGNTVEYKVMYFVVIL